MIPLQIGKLLEIPKETDCNIPDCVYKPLGKAGTMYKGFDVNVLNTAARFMMVYGKSETPSISLMENKLQIAQAWFNKYARYEPLNKEIDFRISNAKSHSSLTAIMQNIAIVSE